MKNWRSTVPIGLYLVIMFTFIYLPVVILVLFSFQHGILPVPPFEGPSLEWYQKAFSNERLMDALLNSVIVAISSSLCATVLGFLAAYGMFKHTPVGARAVRFILMAPMTVSYLIIGLGLLIVFNFSGIGKTLASVAIAHCVINLPICYAIIYSQLGGHLRNIDNAAHDLGASDIQTMIHVILPVMAAPMMAAFLISATLSWDEFIIAFLLSSFDVTLPVMIFEMLRAGLTPEVNAAGTIVFAISLGMAFLAAIAVLLRREKKL